VATLWAKKALLDDGWAASVAIKIDDAGKIASVTPGTKRAGTVLDLALPAPSNVHSHAFQRAMAGLTEMRGGGGRDSFWTWRRLMYKFLDVLTPDDAEAIAAYGQMEMLLAGYASVGEFHYLHHQPNGVHYDNIAEMGARIFAASQTSGIGLTHLPVLYSQGGCDGRPLTGGQLRFKNDFAEFERLVQATGAQIKSLPRDCTLAIAPHSLRAVDTADLRRAVDLIPTAPIHIHIAEQIAEVDEVALHLGARPVEWIVDNIGVDHRWCLIHATQMKADETVLLAKSGAVVGLCPSTESNLGDGIFDGARFIENGGTIALGSDSNIRISLSEEIRTLEYSQRLKDHSRAAMASSTKSTGRNLFEKVCAGGAQALGRSSGCIKAGNWADIINIRCDHPDMAGLSGDALLDTMIFVRDERLIGDVWSAGRHVVSEGVHVNAATIERDFRTTLTKLRATL